VYGGGGGIGGRIRNVWQFLKVSMIGMPFWHVGAKHAKYPLILSEYLVGPV
jgi:hypothetical protein